LRFRFSRKNNNKNESTIFAADATLCHDVHCHTAEAQRFSRCWFETARADVVCANVSVPLNWFSSREQAERVYVTTSYFPPTPNVQLAGVIWLLNGGGGVSTRCIDSTDDSLARSAATGATDGGQEARRPSFGGGHGCWPAARRCRRAHRLHDLSARALQRLSKRGRGNSVSTLRCSLDRPAYWCAAASSTMRGRATSLPADSRCRQRLSVSISIRTRPASTQACFIGTLP
jgi:hypothetical protein